jgi:hypothetical protein
MFRLRPITRRRWLSTVAFPKLVKPVVKCQESLLVPPLPDKILLKSELDASINEKKRFGEGYLETRAVVRDGDKLLGNKLCVYVSSHNGCNMGCQQCWLSQEGLTSMKPVSTKEYV